MNIKRSDWWSGQVVCPFLPRDCEDGLQHPLIRKKKQLTDGGRETHRINDDLSRVRLQNPQWGTINRSCLFTPSSAAVVNRGGEGGIRSVDITAFPVSRLKSFHQRNPNLLTHIGLSSHPAQWQNTVPGCPQQREAYFSQIKSNSVLKLEAGYA